jgi:hypothetical protein
LALTSTFLPLTRDFPSTDVGPHPRSYGAIVTQFGTQLTISVRRSEVILKSASHPIEQPVGLRSPPMGLYAVAHGHRLIILSPHNRA